jgi:phosphate starvation-inducible PhoH-like protein
MATKEKIADFNNQQLSIKTKLKLVQPRTPTQCAYVRALQQYPLVFGLGPAGTGKTYMAVARGVELLLSGEVKRLVLSRPAVEAGEQLGFLPGDLRMKLDPYMRPIYDALHDMLPADMVAKKMETGEIEVAPLAFMRGRTLADAMVLLDEAQNTTPVQMKMFLTRLGEGSRMVITGDLTQIDLPKHATSGLAQALAVLQAVPDIARIEFSEADVVRHPLVAKIIAAYRQHSGG